MKIRNSPIVLFILLLACVTSRAVPIEGIVTEVNPDQLQITLKTGGAGNNEATVFVGRGDARILEAGDAIRGDLVPFGKGKRLQTIWPNDPIARGTISRMGDALRKDTLHRGSKVFRAVGEYLPKFALYDSNGDLFLSESLKGNYVIMNFVFTRCANPDMCPAATARMKELQDLIKAGDMTDLHLVSITLDPAYDTPGIWTAYAEDKELDTSTFHLLGGPAEVAHDMRVQMGVLSEPDEEEIIRHTMSTALIDPTGKIIYRIPGSFWRPEDFLKQYHRDKNKRN